ncbi:hypothetical protein E4U44_000512, partial [Claviceps purpurea]
MSLRCNRSRLSRPKIYLSQRRQGPITNTEAQQLITSAEFLNGNKFWYGAHKRRGVEGAKRVLVLEETTTMTFLDPNEYELRFRPENRSGKCELRAVCLAKQQRPQHFEVPVFGRDDRPKGYANEAGGNTSC